MRTTLTIADDVLAAVKELARRQGRTAGEVLSDLARQALTGTTAAADAGPDLHGFRPFPRRGRAVSNELIDRLREDEGV
ncbi:MAG: ribbon-helix-helix domain-containing protein [Actinobacteria bacterium]|nr:ribbon-helix-helix domain-containing protein [Actinomycetota bacterium]